VREAHHQRVLESRLDTIQLGPISLCGDKLLKKEKGSMVHSTRRTAQGFGRAVQGLSCHQGSRPAGGLTRQ
jgi:hypothetical protein